MTLGEKITSLRTQHGMSQGDLAEKIAVSRQSISKWETDASIPELDKLIQLSELFHLSLDELVKGERVPSPVQTPPVQVIVQKTRGTKELIGALLVCFGALILLLFTLLGGFWGGLLFGAPFMLCGGVCLLFKKNTGLWLFWTLFFAANIFFRYATGITWRLTLFTLHYEPDMNYLRLIFAWCEVLILVTLMVITVLRFQKKPLVLQRRGKVLYAAGWLVLALLLIPLPLDPLRGLTGIYLTLTDWAKVILLTVLSCTTLRLVRTRKAVAAKE